MALSNLKLYQSAGSPNSRRVRIFLAEKGLKPTLVPVDLGKGEHRSSEYRNINPRQMIPVLVLEDGTARAVRHWHSAVSSRPSASA